MPTPVVELRHVSKEFKGGQLAVDDVTLSVEKGEILGIIGHSGAGKSTLIRLVNALEKPTSGEVIINGEDITKLSAAGLRKARQKIGMVFQQFNLFESRTLADNVAYPLTVAKVPKAERDAKVAKLLDFVGLLDRAYDYPSQLSGGQKQRVGIARALANDPSLLLADEATSALDPTTTREVLSLLRRVNQELGVTILLITHGISVIHELATQVAVMTGGQVVEHGDVYDVFSKPQHDVTVAFVSTSVPSRPDAQQLELLRDQYAAPLVSIAVSGDNSSEQLLQQIFNAHGLTTRTVFGGIDYLKSKPLGSLTFAIGGNVASLEAAIAAASAQGVVAVLEPIDPAIDAASSLTQEAK